MYHELFSIVFGAGYNTFTILPLIEWTQEKYLLWPLTAIISIHKIFVVASVREIRIISSELQSARVVATYKSS